jgi:hypothetical protein
MQTGERLDPTDSLESRLFFAQDSSFQIDYNYSAQTSRRRRIQAEIREGLAYAVYFKYIYLNSFISCSD